MLVLVTGANGYIAQHICVLLLEKGYGVVGSVRNVSQGEQLAKDLRNTNFRYVLVPDIVTPGAFDEVLGIHDFDVVLHTASPFHFEMQVEEINAKLLRPAIDGTRNILRALRRCPSVKHVVVTSSYATMSVRDNDPTFTCNETVFRTFSPKEAVSSQLVGYLASKCFAEKAAWEFADHFSLTTVHPSLVFGPQAFESSVSQKLNTSAEVINQILRGVPINESGAFIDVRDVAKAHIVAFEKGLANERLLLQNGRFSTDTIVDIITRLFPVRLEKTNHSWPQFSVIDDSRTRRLLGFDYYSLEESVGDTVRQIRKQNDEYQ